MLIEEQTPEQKKNKTFDEIKARSKYIMKTIVSKCVLEEKKWKKNCRVKQ